MNVSEPKILIVDDHLKNLQLVGKILNDEGYRISLAQNGAEALEEAGKFFPDLILLDVMMPEMDGYEVCSILKEREELAGIPVIFLTARTDTQGLIKGFQAGGVDYITKPFSQEELMARVKNHLELKISKEKILELNRRRDKMYSIIAHDIRSPFSSITQIVDAISSGFIRPGTEDYDEIFKELKERTSETMNLLNRLLDWTKLQSRGIAGEIARLNVSQTIGECIGLQLKSASEKNIQIIDHIDENTTVLAEVNSLTTIMRNLLSNAIKFTPDNGSITLSASSGPGKTSIRISDTGQGMTAKELESIINSDKNYSKNGTRNEKGSGLGLLIVKDLVRLNRGKIEWESTVGEGTTVEIELPA